MTPVKSRILISFLMFLGQLHGEDKLGIEPGLPGFHFRQIHTCRPAGDPGQDRLSCLIRNSQEPSSTRTEEALSDSNLRNTCF
jgi:hypothetical protein